MIFKKLHIVDDAHNIIVEYINVDITTSSGTLENTWIASYNSLDEFKSRLILATLHTSHPVDICQTPYMTVKGVDKDAHLEWRLYT